jgi:4'-phosphopantetheinyl transferase
MRFEVRSWNEVQSGEELPVGTVHLFAWPTSMELPADRSILNEYEQARLDRYRVEKAREQFLSGRVLLRWILGQYLSHPPELIHFDYHGSGKPRLIDEKHRWLQFNLAHSGEMVVLALQRNAAVGIDLEQLRELPDRDGLVRRFFASKEADRFDGLPECLRTLAFYRAWTAKEAILKSLSLGIAELDRFEVQFEPGKEIAILGDPNKQAWQFHEWTPLPGYLSTVAVSS